ncbi:hypothetical protein K439DRAFT_1615487 [Ramaria rubella]|nr:hypothetical protein K439DRAFT_1615487 [Ramaria rubella]
MTLQSKDKIWTMSDAKKLTLENWREWREIFMVEMETKDLNGYLLGTMKPPSEKPVTPTLNDSSTSIMHYSSLETPLSSILPISIAHAPTESEFQYAASNKELERCNKLARTHLILNVAQISTLGMDLSGNAHAAWHLLISCFEVQDPLVIQDM